MPIRVCMATAAFIWTALFLVIPVTTIAAVGPTVSLGNSKLPIFPGAEGFGTKTVGGRRGSLCRVTVLDESGPGSLRWCIDKAEPRIVVFEIGGTITVSEPLVIKDPYISIFGQSATGSGILIRSSLDSRLSPMIIRTHDVLVQHLRLRAGSSTQTTCCRDALRIANDEPGQVFNLVLDP